MDADFYNRLGIRSVINAAGHYTVYGGSVPSQRVREAMEIAASTMVDLPSLQGAVHAEVARLTRNEAAYVTPGAAAALYLAVAASVSLHHNAPIEELDRGEIERSRVLMLSSADNPYAVSARQAGIDLVRVQGAPEALAKAVTSDTVAVLHALVGQDEPASTLRECRALTRAAGLPLIVDAAAQIPPASNLWKLPSSGADAVIFSGGKALGAPQSTGLIVGSAAFIKWIDRIGFPRHGFGRMFKVGRDQLVGFLAALEELLARDEVAWLASREDQVRRFVEAFSGHSLCEVSRGFPNVAGQPVPYALVQAKTPELDVPRVVRGLRENEPSIAVGQIPGHRDHTRGFIINTLALRDDQVDCVISAMHAVLSDHQARTSQEGS